MYQLPTIDPVAFSVGPVSVHWYGLMYLLAFIAFYGLGRIRAHDPRYGMPITKLDDLLFYGIIGVIVGGRMGYMLFYNLPTLMAEPLSLFFVWQGGMSFHGGLVGVLVAVWIFARTRELSFWQIMDFTAPLVPIGLGLGRIGNFINGELWGRITDVPWAVVFPNAGPEPRHPSQLYEFLLEGVLLFIVLWFYSKKPRPLGRVAAYFALGYGALRFLVEFSREPDAHLGFIALGWMTMGQLLSLIMVAVGIALIIYSPRRQDGRAP